MPVSLYEPERRPRDPRGSVGDDIGRELALGAARLAFGSLGQMAGGAIDRAFKPMGAFSTEAEDAAWTQQQNRDREAHEAGLYGQQIAAQQAKAGIEMTRAQTLEVQRAAAREAASRKHDVDMAREAEGARTAGAVTESIFTGERDATLHGYRLVEIAMANSMKSRKGSGGGGSAGSAQVETADGRRMSLKEWDAEMKRINSAGLLIRDMTSVGQNSAVIDQNAGALLGEINGMRIVRGVPRAEQAQERKDASSRDREARKLDIALSREKDPAKYAELLEKRQALQPKPRGASAPAQVGPGVNEPTTYGQRGLDIKQQELGYKQTIADVRAARAADARGDRTANFAARLVSAEASIKSNSMLTAAEKQAALAELASLREGMTTSPRGTQAPAPSPAPSQMAPAARPQAQGRPPLNPRMAAFDEQELREAAAEAYGRGKSDRYDEIMMELKARGAAP